MSFKKLFPSERARHAGIAIGLALVVSFIALFKPLDIAIWAMQSKLIDRDASGEIVLVEVGEPQSNDHGQFNQSLALAIKDLRERGAERIYVNVPLVRSSATIADRQLRDLLISQQDHVFVADPGAEATQPEFLAIASDPYFTGEITTLDNRYYADFLQFVWGFPKAGKDGRETLSFALAGNQKRREQVAIDGSINTHTIERVGIKELIIYPDKVAAEGKVFLLGASPLEAEVRLAKNGYATASVAHILAAETLIRGSGQTIPPWVMTLLSGIALLGGIWLASGARRRRIFYGLWIGSFFVLVIVAGISGIQASFAYSVVLFAIYGVLRGVSGYQQRHIYVDPITKSPNFSALRRDLVFSGPGSSVGIVVVKILRLDAIFAELNLRQKRLYLQQISKRLALTDHSAKIYFDDGKYFAFIMNDMGSAENRAHLAGLRAIASQPISVEGSSIDVAITVGADFSAHASPEHRLSSAISAADQAREAFRPVFVVSDLEASSVDWDHSLTARLAEALAQDRIKIKLQPQLDLQTGKFVGAEALARWHDKDGREIPPASFISQCEQMGRLDDLTKRVLERSMAASNRLCDAGHDIEISVNVSAVQFVDDRIVQMVENRIGKYSIDPKRLKLEITETARIEDFRTAHKIMDRLRDQGICFSLDDFGVGSANLEALRRLPFQELKIDRMFVSDLNQSQPARSIVEGVLGICDGMGITSVAEGIEDLETLQILTQMGCHYGQGFFIAKPQWISEFLTTLDIPKGKMFRHANG